MVCLALLEQARRVGLELRVNGEQLVLRGPRSAESLARDLLEYKDQVLALLRSQERTEWDRTLREELDVFRARRDRLNERLDTGCAFLADLAERVGEESAEYGHYFAEWEKLLREYETVCGRIECLELTARIRSANQ